jgi:iron complex transport system ATP-binding protein
MTLSAQHVTARAGGQVLLNDVSLALAPGEFVAVLGPNGAGKSTLLRVLAGDLTPHEGVVLLEGRNLMDWSLRERARRRAVLPQQSSPAFPFTALEVAALGRTAWRGRRAEDLGIARAALHATGGAALEARAYPTLSGGEQQRVQLARVLAQMWEPPAPGAGRYVLLDEPTASLDLRHQQEALALLRRLTGQGVGVLAVLHDPNLAFAFADRIVVLSAGRMAAEGTPAHMADCALFQAVFGVAVSVIAHPGTGAPWIVPHHR